MHARKAPRPDLRRLRSLHSAILRWIRKVGANGFKKSGFFADRRLERRGDRIGEVETSRPTPGGVFAGKIRAIGYLLNKRMPRSSPSIVSGNIRLCIN
jgi:hypothetical protein